VLVETAFITNREDERLLSRPEFQERISETLAATIKNTSKKKE
jgi:N-acetylmuramoyl-L-alanine amidase